MILIGCSEYDQRNVSRSVSADDWSYMPMQELVETHVNSRILETLIVTPVENLSAGDIAIVGYAHIVGLSTKRNFDLGMQLLDHACQNSHHRACALQAYYLLRLESAEAQQRAVLLSDAACEAGILWGCTVSTSAYAFGAGTRPDITRAINLASQSCQQPSQAVCSEVARFVMEVDVSAGVHLYEQSCGAGNATACYNLGREYQYGEKIDKDAPRAAPLYDKSCRQGHEIACAAFLVLWQLDYAQTDEPDWYMKKSAQSCEAGYLNACQLLVRVYSDTAETGKAKNPEGVLKYSELGCGLGNLDMCRWAGEAYRDGIGTEKNLKLAYQYFNVLCQADDQFERDHGCRLAADLNVDGTTNSKTEKMIEACELGAAQSCRLAAWNFASGKDVTADSERAVSLFQIGCLKGDGASCLDLGALYDWAQFGVAENKMKARSYYARSCKLDFAFGCRELERFDQSEG